MNEGFEPVRYANLLWEGVAKDENSVYALRYPQESRENKAISRKILEEVKVSNEKDTISLIITLLEELSRDGDESLDMNRREVALTLLNAVNFSTIASRELTVFHAYIGFLRTQEEQKAITNNLSSLIRAGQRLASYFSPENTQQIIDILNEIEKGFTGEDKEIMKNAVETVTIEQIRQKAIRLIKRKQLQSSEQIETLEELQEELEFPIEPKQFNALFLEPYGDALRAKYNFADLDVTTKPREGETLYEYVYRACLNNLLLGSSTIPKEESVDIALSLAIRISQNPPQNDQDGVTNAAVLYKTCTTASTRRAIDYQRRYRMAEEKGMRPISLEATQDELNDKPIEPYIRDLSPSTVEETAITRETWKKIFSKNNFPFQQKIVLWLHAYYNLPNKDIAEILECSRKTIRDTLYKARQYVKTDLRKETG